MVDPKTAVGGDHYARYESFFLFPTVYANWVDSSVGAGHLPKSHPTSPTLNLRGPPLPQAVSRVRSKLLPSIRTTVLGTKGILDILLPTTQHHPAHLLPRES